MDFNGFVSLIAGLGDGDKNTAFEVRTILTHVLEALHLPGDIKIVFCTREELISDYTSTGVGKGKRAGWAQCNGLDGRPSMGGRTVIGFSDSYSELGALGGSEKHKLLSSEIPTIGIDIPYNMNNAGGNGNQRVLDNSGAATTKMKAYSSGGDQPHNNMQPYIVLLYLIKL
ncbi:hypothetical protein [Flavobacterium panacagri]|uniref:hypothetical protein n=1 Tax=Flavobacterium panacagri TaxID=3034146 RepID=UPI0025A51D32|nr:hypothetical protein [Flavobacterium panacagri]